MNYYKKPFRFKKFGKKKAYSKLIYSNYGLQVLEDIYLKKEHLISVTKAIKSVLRKKNILCLRVFLNKIYTKKPTDVRMGRGKGNMAYRVCILKKGSLLLELKTIHQYKSFKALNKASIKIPVKTHIISRNFILW